MAGLLELEEREWSAVGRVEAAAGWEPVLLTLSGVQGGPIASPLEPPFLAFQPAGPLEEGLSLFFNKLLTISAS